MKKLSIKLLDELAKNQQRISELEMKSFVGGGSGTLDDPYSEYEATIAIDFGTFKGGWVEDSNGIVSYWHKEIIVTPNGVYSSPYGAYGYIYGSYSGWGQYGSYGYESYYNGSNTLEQALVGAGIGVGVQGFCMNLAQVVCENHAARQAITEAMEASLNAAKIAGKFSKGFGAVGLVFSICGSSESITAVINRTGDTADWLNTISIGFGAVGVACTLSTAGAATPIGLVCGGVSITLSVVALVVDE